MKEIETLIPQREPFLFVDEITSCSREKITGSKIFGDTNPLLKGSFPDINFVPGVILIEALAQCGGAGLRLLEGGVGLFGFASIENVIFHKGVDYDSVFSMEITNLKIAQKYIKQSGKGYVNNELAIELTWMCLKF